MSCHQFPLGPVFHRHSTPLQGYICHIDNISSYQASPSCKYSKLQQTQRTEPDLRQPHRQRLDEMSRIGPFILFCFIECFVVEGSTAENFDVYCVWSPARSLGLQFGNNTNTEYISLTSVFTVQPRPTFHSLSYILSMMSLC